MNKEANAAEKFKELNKAYEALVDEEKRARYVDPSTHPLLAFDASSHPPIHHPLIQNRYDRFGEAGVEGRGFGGGPQFVDDFDIGDIFDSFFGGRLGGWVDGWFGVDLKALVSSFFFVFLTHSYIYRPRWRARWWGWEKGGGWKTDASNRAGGRPPAGLDRAFQNLHLWGRGEGRWVGGWGRWFTCSRHVTYPFMYLPSYSRCESTTLRRARRAMAQAPRKGALPGCVGSAKETGWWCR